MRHLPNIPLAEIEGYARLLAKGWDGFKETFKVDVGERLIEQLEVARREARDDDMEAAEVMFGGECMKLWLSGARGTLFVLENDDFRVLIKPPKFKWCVSVEYTAAGLWEYGLDALRERAIKAVVKECPPLCSYEEIADTVNWQRVSRADFAFDFYSPEFSKDMRPALLDRIVCPSPVKKDMEGTIGFKAHGRGIYLETVTIGKKDSLQIQIYDKGKEITEASGKTWMFELWEREGYYPPEDRKAKDVWRMEIRFGGEFLKDRGILTIEDLYDVLPALLTEAIYTRRLTVESVKDKNRWRWAMHPLYVAALREVGESIMFMLPLGRRQTETAQAMADSARKSIAGQLRTLTVLLVGDLDEGSARRYVDEIYKIMLNDPDGRKKVERARLRYMHVGEAA